MIPDHAVGPRRPRGRPLAAILGFGILAGCGPPEAAPPVAWNRGDGVAWHAAEAEGSGVGFTRLDEGRTGVTFVNRYPEEELATDRVLGNGSGVAVGDYDGDGWTDLFFVGIDGELVLYRNLGDWRFHDVTREAGIRAEDRRYTGASFADTDGDGDLDLYVSNYKRHFALDALDDVASGRTPIVQRTPAGIRINPALEEHYALITTPMGQRYEEKGEPDRFFLNDGDRFRPASFTEHFRSSDGHALAEEPTEFGLSARFYDVNGDGHPDLYICNDFAHPDRLWLGDGKGRFTLAPPEVVRTTSHASMGVDFGDVNRDGVVDIVVTDMLSVQERRQRAQELGMFGWPTRTPGGTDRVRQVDRNTLQLGRGDGTFAEIGQYAGISASDWSWTPLLLDADLDGYEDLFIVNGYHWDALNGDALAVLRAARSARAWARFDSLPDPNVAFRNRGDLTFERIRDWGFGPDADIAMGLAAADLDNDGDLDMVASRWDDPPALYRNETTAPRVAIRLRGRAQNTRAVGAVIHVEGGPVAQRKEVTRGGHYLSSSDPVYAFAAGSADTLAVRVRWRDGSWTDSIAVVPGRVYRIHQATTETAAAPPTFGPPAPLFEDVSEQLGRHVHGEPHFDDFSRQPLLPHMLSRMGPGLSWIDVDGDGDDDLVVPGGDGTLSVFTNRGGRLEARGAPLTETDTELLMALPGGGPGGPGVLVTQSRYDEGGGFQPLREAAPVFAARTGSDPAPVLPPDSGTYAAVARADVDGDGNLDLFVAGRTVPGAYPRAPASRLYRAGAGGFTPVDDDAIAALGMVTGVTFSDLDGDGDPDLVVATDWDAPRVLINEGGSFRDATDSLGLAGLTGRWRGVATGDLNGDGRPDIVVTGHGLNVRPRPWPGRPIHMLAADFDGNGVMDPLVGRQDTALGFLAPLDPLGRLMQGLPGLRHQLGSYRKFSTTPLEILAGDGFDRARRFSVSTFAHTLVLSGPGGYTVDTLPTPAQLSAASGVVIADFDGDGAEDVFLAQNLFTAPPFDSRMDAGTGLLLLGDGTGGLRPLQPQRAGVRAYGEQRGVAVADFDGDGRLDLAVAQNGAETKLFRNTGAVPGLRVRLMGTAANPLAVGARLRPVYADGNAGPAREIQAGSGYLSHHSPIQVFGRRAELAAIEVRWPDGRTTRATVPAGNRTLTVPHP